jgi:hypothetical protein
MLGSVVARYRILPGMSVDEGSAVSRRFVAFAPSISTQVNEFFSGTRKVVFYALYAVLAAAVFALTMMKPLKPWVAWSLSAMIAVIVLGSLVWPAYMRWRSRRKILITVTSDGVAVDHSPGKVFSLAHAELGPWVTMGVALHLHSGSHRFVLGGRDSRIASEMRLDAPPVSGVDAWVWASEFEEVLALGERRPAPEGATRCLLYPNPYLAEEVGPLGFRKHLHTQPSLFLDVGDDAIRIIDPSSDVMSASVAMAQVAATPAAFRPEGAVSGDGTAHGYPVITGLVIGVPGAQPLTIGCLDLVGSEFRFSWGVNAARPNERPAYVVSGGDWLTLVEAFGLTAQLHDSRG